MASEACGNYAKPDRTDDGARARSGIKSAAKGLAGSMTHGQCSILMPMERAAIRSEPRLKEEL